MYSMSVSIHRIYTSVTLTFFFFLVWHFVPQRTKSVAFTGMAFSPLRTDWVYSCSKPGWITLCEARKKKKKRFQFAEMIALNANACT